MNTRLYILSALTALGMILGLQTAVSAENVPANQPASGEHKFEKAKKYYAECQGVKDGDFEALRGHLKAFTDMEVMADYMSDPVKFAQLMQTVNDPRTIHVMMKCSTEPVMWDTWLKGMTDYNKMMRVGMRFMNPTMYMNWMMAPMNPQIWKSMSSMMSPASLERWSTAMMNPAFYQPMFAPMNPDWYTTRMQWMTNPQSMQPIYNLFGMQGMMPAVAVAAATPALPATAAATTKQ